MTSVKSLFGVSLLVMLAALTRACFPALESKADARASGDTTGAVSDGQVEADGEVTNTAAGAADTVVRDSAASDDDAGGVGADADAGWDRCTAATVGEACDDANPCTLGDRCADDGTCAGAPRSCDDGKACTLDTCDAVAGCVHSPLRGAQCDDGDACTDGDACDAAGGCVGAPRDCDDHSPCTEDSCAATGTCEHVPVVVAGLACDDGDACTHSDACDGAGACVGTALTCVDGNPCTADSCDATAGACQHVPLLGEPCDDADLCTTGDACDAAGACVGAAVPCDDGDPCTIDTCWPGSGLCASRPMGVTISTTVGGVEVRGEFHRGRATRIAFLVTGLQTRFGGLGGQVSATFLGPGLVPPVFAVGSFVALNTGDSFRLNDALVASNIIVGVGAIVQGSASSGVVAIKLTGGAQETNELADAAELRSVAQVPGGFVAVGRHTPTSQAPGGIAVVRISDSGAIMDTASLGDASDDALYAAARGSDLLVAGRRGASPVLVRLDAATGLVKDTLALTQFGWAGVDAAAGDGAHVVIAGHSDTQTRIAVAGTDSNTVSEFGIPDQPRVTAVAVAHEAIAVTGSRVWDAWVGVFDLGGTAAWDQTFDGGQVYAQGRGVLIDPNGNVTVVGLAAPTGPSTSASWERYFMQAHFTDLGAVECVP